MNLATIEDSPYAITEDLSSELYLEYAAKDGGSSSNLFASVDQADIQPTVEFDVPIDADEFEMFLVGINSFDPFINLERETPMQTESDNTGASPYIPVAPLSQSRDDVVQQQTHLLE